MRKIEELPIAIELLGTSKRGGAPLGNITAKVGKTWRHSVRRVGGYWMASCTYEGDLAEMQEIFLEGMMREVRATFGGMLVWKGFLGEAALSLNGVDYYRSWLEIANRVKTLYTRIGDYYPLANPGAESGAWAALGTPSTREQSTDWYAEGDYSCHVVADSMDDGVTIESGIGISLGKYYECQVSVKIVSGTWRLMIWSADAKTADGSVGAVEYSTPGQYVMRASVPESNQDASSVDLRLYCTTSSGEIYADAAVFQEGSCGSATGWCEDTASQDEFGVIELALLKAGMDDGAANAEAQRTLAEMAWPRTQAPNEFSALGGGMEQAPRLELTFFGEIFTARNKYCPMALYTTATCSEHVSNLIAACEFLSEGVVETNAMDYLIDSRAPQRIWECLRDITLAGDASGNRWQIGVNGDGTVDYRAADTTVSCRFRNGRIYNIAGGEMEAWLMQPGLCYMDDLPTGPTEISGLQADDPHVMTIDEVTFDAGEWLNGGSGLRFGREAKGD